MLHANPSDRYVVIFRTIVFGIWILKFAFDPLQRLADLPIELFTPPFPQSSLPSEWYSFLLSTNGLGAIRITGLCVCFLCLWRRFLPTAGLVASLTILLYQCLVRGFGHINHAEIVAMLAAFIYVLCSFTRDRRSNPEPLAIAFALCFSYTLIAAHRFAFGGVSIFTSDTIVYWAANNSSLVSYFDFTFGRLAASNEWFGWALRMGFLWVTLCELIAPIALIVPRLRIAFFLSILGFHIGTLFLMNILFWENMVLLIALFAPFLFEKKNSKTQLTRIDETG